MSARIFRRAHLFSSLAAVAVVIVMALAAMERTTATLANPPEDATVSATGRRGLHTLPYAHSHFYQTQTPTLLPDDEYYTDDGAINADMVREKKDMYQQDGNGDNDNDETNQSKEASALESEQTVRSSATTNTRRRRPMANLLFIGGINTIMALSFFFW
jgi:hypothetical protein